MKERTVKIELTPDQKEQVKKATGKDVPVVRLSPEPLEERVSPDTRVN